MGPAFVAASGEVQTVPMLTLQQLNLLTSSQCRMHQSCCAQLNPDPCDIHYRHGKRYIKMLLWCVNHLPVDPEGRLIYLWQLQVATTLNKTNQNTFN